MQFFKNTLKADRPLINMGITSILQTLKQQLRLAAVSLKEHGVVELVLAALAPQPLELLHLGPLGVHLLQVALGGNFWQLGAMGDVTGWQAGVR